VSIIARDASPRLRAGTGIHVRTTELGLLINHDYLSLLSAARGDNIDYSWWPGSVATGPEAPDYIVHTRGFGAIYPGVHYFEYYPTLDADVASGRLPYEVLQTLDGPAGSAVMIYKKRPFVSRAGAPNLQGAIYIQAESFQHGTVAIDTGQYGYGAGIGVILSPKPPSFAEYGFRIADRAQYQIDVRYASAAPRPFRVFLDGKLLNSRTAESTTGGFDPAHQLWQPVAILHLDSGPHTMRLESDTVLPHIDQFCIAPILQEKSQ
jgi:hypothetical protein